MILASTWLSWGLLLALALLFVWLFSPLSDDRFPPDPPRRPADAKPSSRRSAGASRSSRRRAAAGATTGERARRAAMALHPAGVALLRPCTCGRPTTGDRCSECAARSVA